MKIALLGKGKTGSKILECTDGPVEVFDSKNRPTHERLSGCDVIISFLPGDAFLELIPLLLETRRPVVTGSTGFQWPRDFEQTLKDKKISWIFATNFSLGVLIVKQLIERLHQVDHILPNRKCSIHEIHHTKKLDAPSGTALSMKEWLQEDCEITSEREGDVVGHHALKVDTGSEVITLTHEALDRRLFAEGAIFAAKLLTTKTLEPGLHPFQRVVERHLSI